MRLDFAARDRRFELLLDLADEARRREAERLHHGVADARRERRLLCVLGGEERDAPGELLDLVEAFALLLGALGRDVGAREAEQIVEVLAELAREAAHGAVGPARVVLVRAEVMEDEEADRVAQRRLGREHLAASFELVEHARADLGVPQKMHLSVGADRARLRLADVVEERCPAHLEARHGLTDDLLRVLPDVLVAPLGVPEAHHRVHFGEEDAQRADVEQRVETQLGIFPHDDAIEAVANGLGVEPRRDAEVLGGDRRHHLDDASLLGGDRGQLEGGHRAIRRSCGRGFAGHGRGLLGGRVGGRHSGSASLACAVRAGKRVSLPALTRDLWGLVTVGGRPTTGDGKEPRECSVGVGQLEHWR